MSSKCVKACTKPGRPLLRRKQRILLRVAFLPLMGAMLVSCAPYKTLTKVPAAPIAGCSERVPGVKLEPPPLGSTDWLDWAEAWVQAAYALTDSINKRAATAECLDKHRKLK